MKDNLKQQVNQLIAETDSRVLRHAVMRCYCHFMLIFMGLPIFLGMLLALFMEPLLAIFGLFFLPLVVIGQGFMFGLIIGGGQYFQKRRMGVL